ncbi:hypothetical protein K466DRAFT_573036 [Polyporus arcularius HHB13444]|uniref:Uncharacterized protein n=1 Tax=Polyporus arcularius HHB13444 TaxID=1314778 RepID=A0A5C3PTC0_9APHY|nr:hypothetical protein K466DRAFT_573036 [Polyporus arcularius HHB13444]
MLTTIIGNAHFSSGAMRRAVLSSIAAVFGTDTLPPIYSLDDDSGQEEEELIPVPPSVDQSEAEQAQADEDWEDWLTNTIVVSPPSEDHDLQSTSSAVFSPALSAPPSLQASSGATLDPTSPEFVPSFLLDTMRPLPPGPGASSAPEDRLSNVHDWEERQRNGEVLLVATSSTLAPESSSSAAPAQTDSDGRADLVVQDADPPFMTDGRGRVVWSSTTISRGREGRRGRAASSSATIVPHPKTTPDLSAAEETSEEASQHESPGGRSASASGRLVRQRSLPLVGYVHGADGGTHLAEFMTDGRGRVVFASSR